MGKRRSWFTFVKRLLFIPEAKPKAEKKPKRWKWFLGRFKFKQCPPAIEAPQKTLTEATEQQKKHALAVALATAAAAEAAVAAANAAAEVVRLTIAPYELERKRRSASIRIQTAYRAHLARKALSALKGLVKLQAVIRGELVRQRLIAKLKFMLPFQMPKPRVYHIRVPTVEEYYESIEKKLNDSSKESVKSNEFKQLKCNNQRTWDFSLASKEEIDSLFLRRQEAIAKRERMMKYSFSHRERRNDHVMQEPLIIKENRRSSRFDQWEEIEAQRKAVLFEQLRSFADSSSPPVDMNQLRQARKLDVMEDLNSPSSLPRRSFSHVKQKSIGDDISLPSSPMFPTYMAATESAKAKTRSMSTPKQRLMLHETYSGQHSPYTHNHTSWTSYNGEVNRSTKGSEISQQTAINIKGFHRD